MKRLGAECGFYDEIHKYTDHVLKLNFRQEGARNLNQTQSVPKQFNSNALDDAVGFEFSSKPTLYEVQF